MTGYYPLDAQFWEEDQFFYSLILDYWLESLGGFLDKPCPPGVLLGILGGGVLHDSPNSDQKFTFPHLFPDQTSKIHTRFQTWPLAEIMLSLLRLERKQTNSSNHFEFAYFSFFLTNSELKR